MSKKIEVTRELIHEAAGQPIVLKALKDIAKRIQGTASSMAAAENVDASFWIEESVRPGWRPQVQVLGDSQQEWGSSNYSRFRILARAGEQSR